MKKHIIFLTVISLMAFASAMTNEPDGFRGIKWKSSSVKLKDMKASSNEDVYSGFKRKKDKLAIGSAKLDDLEYVFYKKEFCMVKVAFSKAVNFASIKETMVHQYGEPPKQFTENLIWEGKDVAIVLRYNEITETGNLVYMYKPIMKQITGDEKESAHKGVEDL